MTTELKQENSVKVAATQVPRLRKLTQIEFCNLPPPDEHWRRVRARETYRRRYTGRYCGHGHGCRCG